MTVAATTLNGGINGAVGTAVVRDFIGFPTTNPYTIRIDTEWLRVTAGAGTTSWTVTRGYNGTTAAAHSDGASVYSVPDTYPDLLRINRRLRGDALTFVTTHDDLLTDLIDAVNSYLVGRIGMFLGPTTLTQIDIDGNRGVRSNRRLYFPFGIQTLSTIQVRSVTGGSLTSMPTTDVILGPRAWEPRTDPDQPFTWIEVKDVITGSFPYFPDGYENVRLTGTFGWVNPPTAIGEVGDTLVIKMFQARQSSQRDVIGSDDYGNPMVSRFMSMADENKVRQFMTLVNPGYVG